MSDSDEVVRNEPDGITPLALLQEWVVELGLPSWDQAEGRLREGSATFDEETGAIEEVAAYCCLGVACELGVRHGLVERREDRYRWIGPRTEFSNMNSWNDGVLPEEFAQWLGIVKDPKVVDEVCPEHREMPCPAGYKCEYRDTQTLSSLNDAGHPFVFIRDRIQSQIVAPREAEETVV